MGFFDFLKPDVSAEDLYREAEQCFKSKDYATAVKLFEQAYGGDVIRIFGFRAANAQPVFRGYPVIFRLMSMPILSNISESDIPRKLACREVSLLSALFSMVAC